MHPPHTMDDHLDRLERAREALNDLIQEEKEREQPTEVERLVAKREGVMLAISYARESIRMRDQPIEWSGAQQPPWVLVVRLPDNTPPVAARIQANEGSQIMAFCSGLGESVLRVAEHAMAGDKKRSDWKGDQ